MLFSSSNFKAVYLFLANFILSFNKTGARTRKFKRKRYLYVETINWDNITFLNCYKYVCLKSLVYKFDIYVFGIL